MTTISEIAVRCAVCGAPDRAARLAGTSSFGPPDLDLRPYGPARWALEFAVQRCRSCGYCAGSTGQAPPGARGTVESVVYRDVLERSRLPRLARSLFCAALLDEAAGEPEAAAWHFLQAAWACDDRSALTQARICRERAAEMLGRALETGDLEMTVAAALTLTSDVWRRAGRFEEAVAAAAEAEQLFGESPEDEAAVAAAAIAAYIRALADSGDDELHNTAEAFADEG